MLAALSHKIKEMGAVRIVFDALDIVLALLPDAAARRFEMNRLNHWLLDHEITALITEKAGGEDTSSGGHPIPKAGSCSCGEHESSLRRTRWRAMPQSLTPCRNT